MGGSTVLTWHRRLLAVAIAHPAGALIICQRPGWAKSNILTQIVATQTGIAGGGGVAATGRTAAGCAAAVLRRTTAATKRDCHLTRFSAAVLWVVTYTRRGAIVIEKLPDVLRGLPLPEASALAGRLCRAAGGGSTVCNRTYADGLRRTD